jgi:hypothetical protein
MRFVQGCTYAAKYTDGRERRMCHTLPGKKCRLARGTDFFPQKPLFSPKKLCIKPNINAFFVIYYADSMSWFGATLGSLARVPQGRGCFDSCPTQSSHPPALYCFRPRDNGACFAKLKNPWTNSLNTNIRPLNRSYSSVVWWRRHHNH